MHTVRITDPPLESTKDLVKLVIALTSDGSRVRFLTPPGIGADVVQRIRVMISRGRNQMRRARKPMKYFKIHHTILKWTSKDGTRHDCVIIWQSRNLRHIVTELAEDFGV